MEPASVHLYAELSHPTDSAGLETLRWVGSMLGFKGQPPAHVDLVVRRRDTEAEVLRITLDNTDEADFTLDIVNHDLGRLGVADFVREWRQPPQE